MASGARALAILGSTGSIGTQTLDVIDGHPGRFRVVTLAAGGNRLDLLAQQVRRYRPELVAVPTREAARDLADQLAGHGPWPEIVAGEAGLVAAATHPGVGLVVGAMVGIAGLPPVLAALEQGRDVALANKEALVVAGSLVMAAAARSGARLIPVDSEHSAIFQCLAGSPGSAVRRLILTASGGPFRGWKREDLARVTREQALQHPRWQMGPKVTVDSATLMNKALEMIEAHWLFAVPIDRIDVLVHPQSIVHSLVEFVDGSMLAQLSVTDMRLPIQYALGYPERLPGLLPPLDLATCGCLQFEPPDLDTFPSLNYARAASTIGGTLPAAMNAANEVAVERFLAGELSFLQVFEVIERIMERHRVDPRPDLIAILAADQWARQEARGMSF